MKVLLAHNFYQQPGGEDQVFADEGRLLESHGHTVLRHTVHNDSIEGMSRVTLAGKTIWNTRSYKELRDLVAREQIDVVHFHNTFPLISPAAYAAVRSAGAAVIQGVPNYRLLCPSATFLRDGKVCEDCLGKTFAWPSVKHKCYRDSRAITGVIASMLTIHRMLGTWAHQVDIYIALTEFVKAKLIEGGIPKQKIRIKGNFVSPDPKVGDGAGNYAAFIGRLSPEKGIMTLLRAWEKLGHLLPLKIVGDGPEADKVREAAKNNPAIEWLGRQSGEKVLEVVGNAKFLAFPSEWYEGQPKVILEAFAKGTPVLASRHGSMVELINDGIDGKLFTPGDADDLVAKVTELVAEPGSLTRMRFGARQAFERTYTATRNYEILVSLYNEAIAIRTGGHVPAATAKTMHATSV